MLSAPQKERNVIIIWCDDVLFASQAERNVINYQTKMFHLVDRMYSMSFAVVREYWLKMPMMGPFCVWIKPATVQTDKFLIDCSPARPVRSEWFWVVFKRSTSLPLTPPFAPPSIKEPEFGQSWC